jgi:hypothetical protein
VPNLRIARDAAADALPGRDPLALLLSAAPLHHGRAGRTWPPVHGER